MTDASIKRLLKAVKEKMKSENTIGHGLGSMDAVRVYREWIKDEINHNGYQWKDWRCAEILVRLSDKLSNPQYISGVSTSAFHITMIQCFRRDLMVGIFYDWQEKTVAIDKLHNAQNQLAELVS